MAEPRLPPSRRGPASGTSTAREIGDTAGMGNERERFVELVLRNDVNRAVLERGRPAAHE